MGTVILSLMRPRIAAQTLEQFDLETRYDLLRRLADKGETHPDVSSVFVDMVQQEIESRQQPAPTPGMQAVKKILEHPSGTKTRCSWGVLIPVVRSIRPTRRSP